MRFLEIVRSEIDTVLGFRYKGHMNKTPTTKKLPARLRRALCSHCNVIELDDGVKVCIACEAVLK